MSGPVLEALWLNTKNVYAAAASKYSGTVDATNLVKIDKVHGDGRISRVIDGVFNEDGGDDEESDEVSPWFELGSETDTKWKKEVSNKLD